MPTPPVEAPAKPSALGEKTGSQSAQPIGLPINMPGFGTVGPATYKMYRRMRNNPNVALARAIFMGPIKSANWSYEVEDNGNDTMRQFIEAQLDPLRYWILHNTMFGLDYGHADFEKVWEVVEGKLGYRKLKPLRVENTDTLVDKDTGAFLGVKNNGTELMPADVFHWTYDMEAGNFNGRSWFDNIVNEWHAWNQTRERLGKYLFKVAGTIPIMRYAPGEAKDENGVQRDNSEHAQRVLQMLGQGHGVAMQNTLTPWAQDAMRQGIDVSKLMAWSIEFLETKGRHGAEFVESMRHFERQIFRGLLVPERVATEGEHGTKAESGVHADIALQNSQEVLDDVIQHVNWYLVDPLLAVNWGAGAVGGVVIKAEPVVDRKRALIEKLVTQVLAPQNADLFARWLSVDGMMDILGLPKSADSLDEFETQDDEAPTPVEERDVFLAGLMREQVAAETN